MIFSKVFGFVACVAVAQASYGKNLNYRSPSENHPSLGVSIRKVVKRSDPAVTYQPSQLNFTHGVASGGELNLPILYVEANWCSY